MSSNQPAVQGLELSLCHILQNLHLERQLRHQPLQLGVLPIQFLETSFKPPNSVRHR